MYDKTHYNIVISLQLIKKKSEKKNWLYSLCCRVYLCTSFILYTIVCAPKCKNKKLLGENLGDLSFNKMFKTELNKHKQSS